MNPQNIFLPLVSRLSCPRFWVLVFQYPCSQLFTNSAAMLNPFLDSPLWGCLHPKVNVSLPDVQDAVEGVLLITIRA